MLTDRERQVVQLAANGLSSKEIGKRLGLSKKTAEAHLRASRIKLSANNTSHLIAIALRSGFIASLFMACAIGSSIGIDDILRPSKARTRISRTVRNGRGKREWEIIG